MAAQDDAFTYIEDLLSSYGLSSLAHNAWQKLIDGVTQDQVIQWLRTTPEYAQRFPGMAVRRAKGLSAISEGEYISYERQAGQILHAAGMPAGFYDTPEDFADLIGKDLSLSELNQRITNNYIRVAQAAPEVRNAFQAFFGPDGDTALAAFFMDPDKAQPFLERAVTEAEISGAGARFGVGVNEDMANRLATIGVTSGQAQQGFQQLNQIKPLFNETITETTDLKAEQEGVGAVFGTDATSADAVRKRRDTRAADFSGTTQQALGSQTGLTGLGSAKGY